MNVRGNPSGSQRISSRFTVLLMMALFVVHGAPGQQIDTPWRGEPGVTETVETIMARERARGGVGPFSGYQVKPEPGSHPVKLPLTGSPAVSRWPLPTRSDSPEPMIYEGDNPQVIGTSFLGTQISDGPGYVPPDCMGDVGPTQIMVAANGRIRVFDKNGTLGPLNADMDAFFSSVRGSASTSDPHIRYDRIAGRWFVVIINVSSTNNRVLIAESDGATITGTSSFTFFFFQHNLVSPPGDNGRFADYPTLGVDANALYIGTNNFQGTSFASTTGFVVRKSDLLLGTLTVTAFRNLHNDGANAGLFTPQGVDNDDPAATEGYFVGVDNFFFGLLQIRRVSDPGGTPTISGNLGIVVPATYFPVSVPALGTSTLLDALDDRLFAAHLKKDKNSGVTTLWTAHNLRLNSSGVASATGDRDGCRWYQIGNLTTTPTLIQAGTLFDPAASSPQFFWIPSVAMSGQGHMALGASVAGSGRRAEIVAAGRLAGDVLGVTQSFTLAQSSTTAYNITVTNPQRWGDFSQTVVDPSDDMTMWTFQEYCNATNSWGVRAIKLLAPPPATPTSVVPPQVAPVDSVDVTVTGTSVAGSGFFDPGVGFPNRLSATILNGPGAVGSVSVTNVMYNSPTSVTLTLNTSAASGDYLVRMTNPDSQQSASATPVLTVNPALPIQLSSFTATVVNGANVLLEWTTLTELNNFGFEVEKSRDRPDAYQTISNSFIPGHGTTLEPHYYSFTDLNAGPGHWWYRLKQFDLDGTIHRSEGVQVDVLTGVAEGSVPVKTALFQNYPNPFNPSTNITYQVPNSGLVTLKVFDVLGREVATLVNGRKEAGTYTVVLDARHLASGMYVYRMTVGEFVEARKFVVSK